jgi:hypothetical protein
VIVLWSLHGAVSSRRRMLHILGNPARENLRACESTNFFAHPHTPF